MATRSLLAAMVLGAVAGAFDFDFVTALPPEHRALFGRVLG